MHNPDEVPEMNLLREGSGVPRRSRHSSLECDRNAHVECVGVSGALDALWCGCHCHYRSELPDRHPAALLRRTALDGFRQRVAGSIPVDPDATVLVSCMHCTEMVEVRTGCKGIDDALSQGWELDGAGDLRCARCSAAQAEMLGTDEL